MKKYPLRISIFFEISILVVSLIVAPFLAKAAETIEGQVTVVRSGHKSFDLKPGNFSDYPHLVSGKNISVVIMSNTRLEGLSSVDDLMSGDQVAVEVTQNKETNIWQADTVRNLNLKKSEAASKIKRED